MDRFAPARCATPPATRQRPRPDAENFGGEVSFRSLPLWSLLFDHLVCAGEQHRRNFEAERLRGRNVYDEIEFGRLLDREIARFRPPQNLVHEVSGAPEQVREVWSVGHQAARFDDWPPLSGPDRKSTRLNSSHLGISYAVFCLKK